MVLNIFCSIFPIILLLNCFFIFFFRKWLGTTGIFYCSGLVILISITLACIELYLNLYTGTYYYIDCGDWVIIGGILECRVAFIFDDTSLVLSIMVLVLSSLAQLFGIEYMAREAFASRLVYLLNFFSTSVVLLFVVYDFFLVIVAWELIGLFSFLLVNYYSQRIYTVKASLKTFIFSRISDLFIFAAYVITINVVGSSDLSVVFYAVPYLTFYFVFINNFAVSFIFLVSLLVAIAGSIKAAQVFSHVWLPDAMEAPTPASALIHSSTLVIMGVFLIMRFSIFFEFCYLTNYFLVIVGSLTIAYGAITASFQLDIKKLVAFSTISQMGYLICGCGFCAYEETLIYLIVHAINKAFLFILVGYTVHFFSANTDFRQIGGLAIYSLDICIFFFIISLNLMGLPFSAGFFAKEFLLFQVLRDDFISYIVRASWLVSFLFTPYYMFKLTKYTVFGPGTKTSWVLYQLKKAFLNYFYSLDVKNVIKDVIISFFKHNLLLSRLTNIVLTLFVFLIFYYSEYLFLLIFELISSSEFLESCYYFSIKNYFSFLITNENSKLLETIMFLVVNFTFGSYMFLKHFLLINNQKGLANFYNKKGLLFLIYYLTLVLI